MKRQLGPAQFAALASLRFQIRLFLHFSEQAARAAGLEPQQHQLLLALRGLGGSRGASIRQLAETLLLRHHSAVGLVDRLSARGYVARRRDARDHRRVSVRLTARGDRVLEKLSRHHLAELQSAGPAMVAALQAALSGISNRTKTHRAH